MSAVLVISKDYVSIMYRILPLFLCFLVCGVFGQIFLEGECNFAMPDYIENVNLTQSYGTWNQISRIDNNVEIGDCSTLTISKSNSTEVTMFSHSEIFNKTLITSNGTIEQVEESPGLFLMKFESNITLKIVFLTTNHTELAAIYSCESYQNNTKRVWAWQYNRNATLSSDQKNDLDRIMSDVPDLENATWRETNHNSTVCTIDDGNAGVRLPIPHFLTIVALVFLAKEFV